MGVYLRVHLALDLWSLLLRVLTLDSNGLLTAEQLGSSCVRPRARKLASRELTAWTWLLAGSHESLLLSHLGSLRSDWRDLALDRSCLTNHSIAFLDLNGLIPHLFALLLYNLAHEF